MIGVVIVDDDIEFARSLATLLELDAQISVVGIGASVADGMTLLAGDRVDVALIDVDMPDGGGGRVVEFAQRNASASRLGLISARQLPRTLADFDVPFVLKEDLDSAWVRRLAAPQEN